MTKIAIIEDDDMMHKMLVEMIANTHGYRCVYECSTSKDALRVLPKHKPDVVLMDAYLSDGSGIDCMARLIKKLPNLQVIIVTLCKDADIIFQALKAGASGYLLKSSRPEEIIQAIAEVQAGGAPMSSEVARFVVRSFRQPPSAVGGAGLTARENHILEFLVEGLSNKEIAQMTGICAGTVRNHLEHIFKKLEVRCRTEAAAKYFRKRHG